MSITKRGGARPGSGRPVADIQLDGEHARTLKIVMLSRGLTYNRDTASAYVQALIDAEWAALDAEFQAEADKEGA